MVRRVSENQVSQGISEVLSLISEYYWPLVSCFFISLIAAGIINVLTHSAQGSGFFSWLIFQFAPMFSSSLLVTLFAVSISDAGAKSRAENGIQSLSGDSYARVNLVGISASLIWALFVLGLVASDVVHL